MKNTMITKELFLNFLRCQKLAYLEANNPELKKEDRASIKEKDKVVKLAQELIAPVGKDMMALFPELFRRSKQTLFELKKMFTTICNATFITENGEMASIHILSKEKLQKNLVEIKSSTKQIMAEDVYCAAYQYYVLRQCGQKIGSVIITNINNGYIKDGDYSKEFFKTINITNQVIKIQPQIKALITRLRKTLLQIKIPEKDLGRFCLEPQPCLFKDYCWSNMPTNNIFELNKLRVGQKLKLYERGIIELKSLPDNTRMDDDQWVQVFSAVDNKIMMQMEKIQDWMKRINNKGGLYFLDVTSAAPLIPVINGTKPNTRFAFQYSLIFQDSKTTERHFYQDLADSDGYEYSRLSFSESLILNLSINLGASILIYGYDKFKKAMAELETSYQNNSSRINGIMNRVVDIHQIFQEKWYYDARFKGLSELDAVYPVVCPEQKINEGLIENEIQALGFYENLNKMSFENKKIAAKILNQYGKENSFKLVKLFEFLKTTIK